MESKALKRAVIVGVGGAAMVLAGAAQAGVSGQGTWETTLQPRDINGDTVTDSFYDTILDVTWLRNANVNGSSGSGNWSTANTWAAALDVYGFTGWRLPTMIDTGSPGCSYATVGTDCGFNVLTRSGITVYSEMAHLFYETLGNRAYYDTRGIPQPGWGLTNTGDFQNMQSDVYWSGLESSPRTGWIFDMSCGSQGVYCKGAGWFALAVRPGDVAAVVPEPQSYGMMLVGLSALMLALRRRPR